MSDDELLDALNRQFAPRTLFSQRELDGIRAALHAAGWRLVPYEPTEAMLDVVVTPIAKSDYQTMLDAAENGDD